MSKKRTKKRPVIPFRFLSFLTLIIGVIGLFVFFRQWQVTRFLEGKPNIIIILTDDQRADTLEYMPTVNAELASNGVTFTNAYITTPLCCPSRVSLYTGLYAHSTGIWTNKMPNRGDFPLGGFQAFGGSEAYAEKDDQTIAVWLKKAGYKTGFAGKYLNKYEGTYIPPGWDDWNGVTRNTYYGYDMNTNGSIVSYGFEPEDYSTDVYTEKAIEFIRKTSTPFFYVVSTDAVHTDGGRSAPNPARHRLSPKASAGGDPRRNNRKNKKQRANNTVSQVPLDEDREDPDQVKDYYAMPHPADRDNCEIYQWEKAPSVNEEDVSDKPQYIQDLLPLSEADMEDIQKFRTSQICALKGVDRAVGRIIEALGDRRDNTVIIFMSDNGFSWGEHRWSKKNCLYEECARVPLVISYPKLTSENRQNDSFALNIDIAPTIAALTGVRIPVGVDGESLLPLLTGASEEVRSEFLLEVYNGRKGYKDIDSAIRTKEYKYAELSSGERELYDMVNDPFELTNLVSDSEYGTVIEGLSTRLQQLREQ